MGFERAHPMVWEYLRTKGLLVIGYSTIASPNRLNFLKEGQRVIVGVPKSQGGTGILGIGKVSGEGKIFSEGGRLLPGVIGSQYMAHMRKIYSDSANKPAMSARCWNKQFKNHQHRLEERNGGWDMTSWEYSQQEGWGCKKLWSSKNHDPNRVFAYLPVQWEQTTDFNSGISKIDWASLGLCDFKLSSLSSVTPRQLTKAHWAGIKASLKMTRVHSKTKESGKTNLAKTTMKDHVQTRRRKNPRTSKLNSLDALLASVGLLKYGPPLHAEEVTDVETLSLLHDEDLKEIGLPMGPRRKLQAILKSQTQ